MKGQRETNRNDNGNAGGIKGHKYVLYAFPLKFLKWTYITFATFKADFHSFFAQAPHTCPGTPAQTQGPAGLTGPEHRGQLAPRGGGNLGLLHKGQLWFDFSLSAFNFRAAISARNPWAVAGVVPHPSLKQAENSTHLGHGSKDETCQHPQSMYWVE